MKTFSPKSLKNDLNMKITFASILVITAVLIVSQVGLPQVQSQKDPDTPLQLGEEIIVQKKFADNEPVKLISIKTEKTEVSLGKAFPKTSDWYKGLEFEMENISDKTITYLALQLTFIRPKELKEASGSDKYPLAIDIYHGGYLNDFFANKESGVAIKHGEIVKIPLKENLYKGMNESLTRLGYPSKFEGVEIVLKEVGFNDRTLWSYGLIYRQDPNDPAKWPPILEKDKSVVS